MPSNTPETKALEPVEVSQAARKAAADLLDEVSSLLGDDGIGQVADLIRYGEYDEHDATLAFARFERDTIERHRQSSNADERGGVGDLPRLDAGLIEAAMIAHYGKSSASAGVDGLDLTADDRNWTFREGFTRMWAGVRKELKRRAALRPQEGEASRG